MGAAIAAYHRALALQVRLACLEEGSCSVCPLTPRHPNPLPLLVAGAFGLPGSPCIVPHPGTLTPPRALPLPLQPTFTFCAEMLGRAMLDAAEGLGEDAPPSSSRGPGGGLGFCELGFGVSSGGYADPNVDSWLDEYAADADGEGKGEGGWEGEGEGGAPSAVDFLMGATDNILPPAAPWLAHTHGASGGSGNGEAMDVAGDCSPHALPPPAPAHPHARPTPRRGATPAAAATPPFMPPPPPGAAAYSAADGGADASLASGSASGASSVFSQSRVAGRLSMDSGSDASGLGSPPGALHWS